MHPTSLLFPLLASILQAAIYTTASSCEPAKCGNLTIKYPFYLAGKQERFCGYRALQLTCDHGGRAYLSNTFRDHLYRVADIFYENNSLLVAAETTFRGDSSCHVPDFNVTSSLSFLPLNVSAKNKNLVFVYDCTLPRLLPPTELSLLLCGIDKKMGVYLSQERDGKSNVMQFLPNNCSFQTVPVSGFGGANASGYKQLIRDGFLLEWIARGDCRACEQSGGECWSLVTEVSFLCSCIGYNDGDRCTNSPPRDGRPNIKIILIVSLSAVSTLLLTCIVWMMHHRKQKLKLGKLGKYNGNQSNAEEILKEYKTLAPKRYKYSELKKITRSFKDKLGEGGFGMVFKGTLQDSRMVAVKLLKGSKGNGEEFLNEIISIGRTSHVNVVVSLIGFCLERSNRALVYEYMANGSLEKYIHAENTKLAIGWEILQEIAIGIARGLEYLHRGCSTRIIHFDIKPHNILLDQDFCPKIADFGLAKLCHLKDSVLSMAEARGTIGFIAPEVFSRGFGIVSTKSDVYSYGMMLLEIVGGRKNVKDNAMNSSEAYFPNWIYHHLEKEMQSCEVTCGTEEIVKKMTIIGLWCIQTNPGNRPSMSKVIEMLEKDTNELEMPPKPILSCPSQPLHASSHSS